jgi:hypothetical protein
VEEKAREEEQVRSDEQRERTTTTTKRSGTADGVAVLKESRTLQGGAATLEEEGKKRVVCREQVRGKWEGEGSR